MLKKFAGPAAAVLFALVPIRITAQAAPPAPVAQPETTQPRPPKARTTKVDGRFDIDLDFDGNPYLLSSGKVGDVASPSADDIASARYRDMEAGMDGIAQLRGAIGVTTDGVGGRDFTIEPRVAYERYALNARRSNLALGLMIAQDLRRDGRVRLRADYVPSYFARNYMNDAVDVSGDGSIQPAERRYVRGEHREYNVSADYRIRLAKSNKAGPFGAFLIAGGGYADRKYEQPWAARDFSGPTGTLQLVLEPRNGVAFETAYDIARLSSRVSSAVLLLDEPLYGQDLNGDGDASDLSARTVQTVDRSRTEHAIGEIVSFTGGRTDVELAVDFRFRTFSSDQPFDAANNGRHDRRLQFRIELDRRLAKGRHLLLGARYGRQSLNRDPDLAAESDVDDYSRVLAHVGFRFSR